MKISTLLSLAFACTVSASTYGQNYKLSMNKQDCSISEVLKEIEKNSEYTFFLNDNQVNVNRKTSVKANNASLEEVLEQALKNTGYQYEIVDRQIIIKSKSVSSVSHPNALFQSSPRKITGQVKDALGEPIIGANVVVKGTTNGTITDIDGNFSLEVPDNAILVVSYIGYTDRTVEVGNSSKVMVSLSEDTQKLDEVVVVGYGTQKKVNLTGAISSLDAETLENRPITNSTQALQGTQGVYVNQAGAQPGADGATIRIRGQGTLNDNNPLILVDGIEFPLEAVNPNDIESISVLQDAASSAIYGSRAANGVVLVKTKGGKKGKFTVDYNNYFGVQQATYLPNFVYDPVVFMEMRNQAQRNEGKLTVDYSDALIEEYKQGMLTDPIMYPQNNWLDIMYNNAFIMEHNMRFSGGDDKYTYSVSLGYGDQNGVLLSLIHI